VLSLLVTLVIVLVLACALAIYAVQLDRERRATLARADARGVTVGGPAPLILLKDPGETLAGRLAEWLADRTPDAWSDAGDAVDVLVHAGFEAPGAPLFYTTIRLGAAVLLPLFAFTFGPHHDMLLLVAGVAVAGVAGVIGPRAILDRLATKRRDRMRKSVPDSLDLMVVCVEAGVGLDSAMLRVARDMAMLHPELSHEFFIVNRKMGAGVTRAEALQGLFKRTGVEELRSLASSMIQSERLGTSIARVLRVYSETLRRKRRQRAEEIAAKAALKMIFPMAAFMLPALFTILLGPASFILKETLKKMNSQ
jgi:tight adherence protein C